MNVKFRIVCATRATEADFPTRTALGRSLWLYRFPFVELRLFAENTSGLPALYNAVLREAERDPAILMFLHDDVHLIDFYWPDHVVAGLRSYDVVGIAGNRRRAPGQVGWCFLDERFTLDRAENLSGAVATGKGWPAARMSYFGPPGPVKLLDGVLLAAHSEALRTRGVAFDERFDFHFYDLDFCRTAEERGLRLGTVPVCLVHESGGAFDSPAWRAALATYRDKWGS